jgi:hypothetical protein
VWWDGLQTKANIPPRDATIAGISIDIIGDIFIPYDKLTKVYQIKILFSLIENKKLSKIIFFLINSHYAKYYKRFLENKNT